MQIYKYDFFSEKKTCVLVMIVPEKSWNGYVYAKSSL